MDGDGRTSRSSSESSSSSSGSSIPYADVELGTPNLHLLRENIAKKHPAFNKGRNKSTKCITTVAVASLVLSTISLVCVAAFFCWMFYFNGTNGNFFHPEGRSERLRDGRVCLPCLQVSPNPLDNDGEFADLWNDLEVIFENDTQICCAENTAQYAALFKLILQRQQEVRKLADALESDDDAKTVGQEVPQVQHDAVSAHLLFKPHSKRNTESTNMFTQHWKSPSDSPMSHVKDGLKFHDNRLYVTRPGDYFIYCQILFSPDHIREDPIVSAYVRRHSILRPASSGILLKMRHTRKDASKDHHSGYVGGVFKLEKGDSLYVEVSVPELVSHDDVASFFGLFKVGE